MKKLFYSVLFLALAGSTMAADGDALWTATGGSDYAKLNQWDATGTILAGWYITSGNGSSATIEPTTDRNNIDKGAVKITRTGGTWTSYHVQLRSLGYTSEAGNTDYNPLTVPTTEPFYWTFYAKVDGAYTLHAGIPDIYSSASNLPQVTGVNTTEWKRFGLLVDPNITPIPTGLTQPIFSFQFRKDGTYYLSDLRLEKGAAIPAEETPVGIVELASDATPITILSNKNGLTISNLEGEISVYSVSGVLIAKTYLSEGINNISINEKGLVLVKYANGEKTATTKTYIK